jgi:hypothetical protein
LIRVRSLAAFALCLLLAACAVPKQDAPPRVELPALRLAPAALEQNIALEQRLVFERGQQRREFDTLLEIDASQVRLLVQAMGQSAVRLVWDGQHLQQRRAPWLPPQVRGERVLRDLQFALWPLAAVRAALPPGWQVAQEGLERRLLDTQGRVWLIVRSEGDWGNLRLRNLAEGYTLEVRSAPAQEEAL